MPDQQRLHELLERYIEDHLSHGVPPEPAALCQDDPELLAPLLELVDAYTDVDGRLPSSSPGHEAPTVPDDQRSHGSPPGSIRAEEQMFAVGDVAAGRYRIERFIDRGGMGEVYEAKDLTLGGMVALKTILPSIAADRRIVERFKREIHLARQITHPNVSRVYDLGSHHGLNDAGGVSEEILFLTMELMSGETLSQRLERLGPFSADDALPIVEQMAAGLEAAHALGILHRDFKASNVFLAKTPEGGSRAVITDFGLARSYSPEATLATLSDSGAVVGTPAYMAPEQIEGEELTPASDIYALGITLYEMMTGRRPFEQAGASPLTVAVRRLSQAPVAPKKLRPDLDPVWEQVILRCLARHPQDRYQRANDVPRALRQELAEEQQPTLPLESAESRGVDDGRSRRRLPRRVRAAVTLGLIVALSATGWLLWRRGSGSTPVASLARPRVAVPELRSKGESDSWLGTALSEIGSSILGAGGALQSLDATSLAEMRGAIDPAHPTRGDGPPSSDPTAPGEELPVDYLVIGEYRLLPAGDAPLLRLDVVLHGDGGDVIASDQATGAAEQLFDTTLRATDGLREKLGLPALTAAQLVSLRALVPDSWTAARSYYEGLRDLHAERPVDARQHFEQAVALAPDQAVIYEGLARAALATGQRARAAQAAATALEHAEMLPERRRAEIEAVHHQASSDLAKAREIYAKLFADHPDEISLGLRAARAHLDAGDPTQALALLETLDLLPAASGDPRIDVAIARACWSLNRIDDLERHAEEAEAKAHRLGSDLFLAQALYMRGVATRERGDLDTALSIFGDARDLFDKAGSQLGMAGSLYNMAITVYRQGDLPGSRRLLERATQLYGEAGDRLRETLTIRDFAKLLRERGEHDQAETLLEQALGTFEELDAPIEQADTLMELGASFHARGKLAEAESRYRQALSILGGTADRSGIAVALTNLAEILHLRGGLDEARELHEEALAIDREIGDLAGAAYDTYQLGRVFMDKGDFAVARERLQSALDSQDGLGDTLSAAETRLALAELSLLDSRPDEAERQAAHAEQFFRAATARDPEAAAILLRADSALARGRTEEAKTRLERADSLLEKSTDRALILRRRLLELRIGAASEASRAVNGLESLASEAETEGYRGFALRTRLYLAEALLGSAEAEQARGHLQSLIEDAGTAGYGGIVEKASDLLRSADG